MRKRPPPYPTTYTYTRPHIHTQAHTQMLCVQFSKKYFVFNIYIMWYFLNCNQKGVRRGDCSKFPIVPWTASPSGTLETCGAPCSFHQGEELPWHTVGYVGRFIWQNGLEICCQARVGSKCVVYTPGIQWKAGKDEFHRCLCSLCTLGQAHLREVRKSHKAAGVAATPSASGFLSKCSQEPPASEPLEVHATYRFLGPTRVPRSALQDETWNLSSEWALSLPMTPMQARAWESWAEARPRLSDMAVDF